MVGGQTRRCVQAATALQCPCAQVSLTGTMICFDMAPVAEKSRRRNAALSGNSNEAASRFDAMQLLRRNHSSKTQRAPSASAIMCRNSPENALVCTKARQGA